jgi:glutamate N-acetyltransferase/amino-acid N-acetyltransferase
MEQSFVVSGIRLGTACTGIKHPNRPDLVLIEMSNGTLATAVFTSNAFCAAPVVVARMHLAVTKPRYLVINTGNANSGTGQQGLEDAETICQVLADRVGCLPEEVLPFSTGVIGEPLPLAQLVDGLPSALSNLRAGGWQDAAFGIMTTDTKPKCVSKRATLGSRDVTVTGIAKGSGMIKPDMATLLAFIATDAIIEESALHQVLVDAVSDSFNAITVDGDTSTNDACILLATGQSGVTVHAGSEYRLFASVVRAVCMDLAREIILDGEGATKFITVQVAGGMNVAECRQVAYTIAHSPLIKTAFFASDPNLGRIFAAVGRSGLVGLKMDYTSIYLDDLCIFFNGSRALGYTEEQGQRIMQQSEIVIRIELGRGESEARILTTDLSIDYIRINAEYRT